MSDDFRACIRTFDQTREELEAIERTLADRLGIRRHVRRKLLELELAGRLVEDEFVREWQAIYSRYLDWAEDFEAEESPRPRVPLPSGAACTQEAANAASLLLCQRVRASRTLSANGARIEARKLS